MINDYRVSNVYYMLAYAFKDNNLLKLEKRKVDVESLDNIYDLFSVILTIFSNKVLKRGLYKNYAYESDELSIVKGKINLNETLKKNILPLKKVVCEYDDFSSNNYLNRIIKSTMFYLIKSNKISLFYKRILKKSYLLFQDIDLIDCNRINWKTIRYTKNNQEYKYIINTCYLILNGLIINQKDGKIEFYDFIDDQVMNSLYEKFVREYYVKHFSQLNPKIIHMNWKIDEGYMVDLIPRMVTDITLNYKNSVMIIDTKYYGKILSSRKFENKEINTINRDNWNQINAYVANASYQNTKKVSGMLLYAKTDEEISPNIATSVMGNKMYVETLDLRKKFIFIEEQLKKIATDFIYSAMLS